MALLTNALMCKFKIKLINHDCLPISMLLYIMLVYSMLFAALSNAVYLYNDSKQLIFVNVLSWLIDTVCLFQILFYIMHSAFNLLVYPNSMFTQFFAFYERAMCSLE